MMKVIEYNIADVMLNNEIICDDQKSERCVSVAS